MIDNNFKIKKEHIIPTIDKGFSNVGFLFGAGTSFEAGYPLMTGLTNAIFQQLDNSDKDIIETAVNLYNNSNRTKYNLENKIPDIELLLNMLIGLKLTQNGYYTFAYRLEQKIKQLISNYLRNILPTNIEYHSKLLNYIKNRVGANYLPIWIFTTNYDLLIELSCAENNIYLENGFCGVAKRFFDIDCYKRVNGYIHSQKQKNQSSFEPHKHIQLKLCKLHGSLSWIKQEENVTEVFDNSLKPEICSDAMIYPEHKKLDETLAHPYDKLFAYANSVLGNEVKYLISCGYSFRDEHINDRLIVPKLKNGSLRVFALFKEEPISIEILKQYPAFNFLTQDKIYLNSNYYNYENNIWKFSEFVKYLSE